MAPDVISSAKAKQGYYCHSFASGSGDLPVEPIKVAMHIHLRALHWLVVSNMTGLFSISFMGCHHYVIPSPLTKSIIFQDGHIAPATR